MYTCPMRKALPFLLGLGIALTNSLASADGERPSSDAISRDLHAYYGGERTSAYVVAVLGALSVGGGVALVTRDSDFARGLGWPLLVLGALEGIGAVIYAFQVGGEIHHYETVLDRDPSAYRRDELAHIHGTSTRFVFYRLTELGLALGGIAAPSYGFAANVDTWKGIGIGVTSIALPFLLIDTINNGRATHYEGQLRSFDPVVPERTAAVPVIPATPFYLSYRTSF
jgi:hypothetical protein